MSGSVRRVLAHIRDVHDSTRSVKSDQDDRHVQSQGVTSGVTDVQS